MRVFRTFQLLLFASVSLAHPASRAQNVIVRVLDAKSGTPQEGAKVEYYCIGVRKSPSSYVMTNLDGIAQFQYSCGAKETLSVGVFPRTPKKQCGGMASLTLKEISMGFVTNPNSAGGIGCPTKVSKKMKPVPGQVVIFVKKPSWYQSHIAG